MDTLVLLSVPLALLVAFAVGVIFWAFISQLRFLSFFEGRSDAPPRLGFVGWVEFLSRTLQGAYKLLWWFFRAAFQAGMRIPNPSHGRPVLCIHGLFMNSTSMWGIRRRLERCGRPTRAVFMGIPFPTPMRYTKPLMRVIEEMARSFPEEGFDIVAHSIGGVITREVLRRRPELASRIGTIITLGSPHHGTAALRWVRFGPIYRMLSRDSEYLANLPSLAELAPRSSTITVASHHDLVVYPPAAAQMEGSRTVTLETTSHLGLLTERISLDVVAEALGR